MVSILREWQVAIGGGWHESCSTRWNGLNDGWTLSPCLVVRPSFWAVRGAAAPPPPGGAGAVCSRPGTRLEPPIPSPQASELHQLAGTRGLSRPLSTGLAAALPLTRLDRAEPRWPFRSARAAMSWVSRVQAGSAILITFRQYARENLEERTRMPRRVPVCLPPPLLPLPLGVGWRV
jgi:hypothetical protein